MRSCTPRQAFRILTLVALLSCADLYAQPTVTITAPDPDAREAGVDPGLYRIQRAGGDTSQPLTVALAYSGIGIAGKDYEVLPPSVVIPAGQSSVDLVLDPINDPDIEAAATDTVVAAVQPGADYTVGSPDSAMVAIADNEAFTNTAPLHYSAKADSATAITVRWTDNFETELKYRVQYRMEGSSTWSYVEVPANTTSRQITNLTTGQAYEFRILAYASNGITTSLTQNPMRQVALDPGSPPAFSTFEQWRAATGLNGALRGASGRTMDDPDGDGCINFFEYLFGRNPLVFDSGGLALAPGPGASARLQWPENPDLLDASSALQDSPAFAAWDASPLDTSATNGVRSAIDIRGSTTRFYRLVGLPAVAENPSSLITCWGDSLTAYATGYPARLAAALGRPVQNCGIGGDTSIQIADRMRGLTLTSPYPATAADTPSGTLVRVVASRTVHSRIMNPANRSSWATYSATIANVTKVELFNRGRKIGESSAPLAASVTSDRTNNPSRLIAPGHPFSYGDVVHFPSGPLPSPLVTGKTYYVRDADAGGFSLVEDDTFASLSKVTNATRFISAGHPFANSNTVYFPAGPLPSPLIIGRTYYVRDADAGGFSLGETQGGAAVTVASDLSASVIKGPLRAALVLTQNFAAPTAIRGPFVFDWIHPGGPTVLSIRTHTDRDANTFIYWMGRNNSSRPHEVYADIHGAVEHIKSMNGRFLILGVLTASNELAGSPYYYNAINLNNLLRKEFPNEFIDIRNELIRTGQPTGQDALDRANDATPTSLRSDTLHLNDAGYQVVADILAAEIQSRGW